MTVYLQVDLANAPAFHRKARLELPEGAAVLDALSAYAEKYSAPGVLENRGGAAVVVNGTRGTLQRILQDEDRVRIFRPRIRG